jgi:hypothetical protein
VLKNSLDTRFRSGSGTKHADFGAFRTQFVVATSPMPTFSTRWGAQGRSHKDALPDVQKCTIWGYPRQCRRT